MEGNIDQMADFVRRETEQRMSGDPNDLGAGDLGAGSPGAVEGADFVPPGNGAPSASPAQVAPSVPGRPVGVDSPQTAAPLPGPPELVGIDIRQGIIYTTIGNFELALADRTKVTKLCLRSVKKGFSQLHATLAQTSTPRPKRGRPAATGTKRGRKPVRRRRKAKKTGAGATSE